MTITEEIAALRHEVHEREKRTCRREIEKYQGWAATHKEGSRDRKLIEQSIAYWVQRLLELS
jgi:hypothetical protein